MCVAGGVHRAVVGMCSEVRGDGLQGSEILQGRETGEQEMLW